MISQSIEKRKENKKINSQFLIERYINIWGDRYDYSKLNYIKNNIKIIIICKKHGEFEQLPSNHCKYGCKRCANESNIRNNELKNTSKINFESKSNLIHNNFYDYSKSEYINAVTKLIIICKTHGEFKITPNNHLRGKGCPGCGKELCIKSKTKPFELYYNEFIKLYNNKYDYSSVIWKGGSSRITVICKYHGEFDIFPYLHKNGKECFKCSNRHSHISIDWLNYMKIKYLTDIQHAENKGEYIIPDSRYKADGYSDTINTIFEFHGDFWHGNPKLYDKTTLNPRLLVTYGELYEKTIEKSNFIKNKGYNIIEIWENDWKKFIKCITILQKKWKNKYITKEVF